MKRAAVIAAAGALAAAVLAALFVFAFSLGVSCGRNAPDARRREKAENDAKAERLRGLELDLLLRTWPDLPDEPEPTPAPPRGGRR